MTYTARELLEAARAVAENAYAPYSQFRVGAVAVGDDGKLYPGVNVENAAYPSGVCAEASAISAAATAGVRKIKHGRRGLHRRCPGGSVLSVRAVSAAPQRVPGGDGHRVRSRRPAAGAHVRRIAAVRVPAGLVVVTLS